MSKAYSKIKDKILEEAQSEIVEITVEAQKQADDILKEAEQEKIRIIEEAKEKADNSAAIERKRTVATSALKLKMMMLEDKEKYIQQTFEIALNDLKKLSDSSDYPRILSSLIVDAGIGLGGGDLMAKVREVDLALIKPDDLADEITSKIGTNTNLELVVAVGSTIGGAIVQQGSTWVDNTFESIFERKKRDIRTEVARILF